MEFQLLNSGGVRSAPSSSPLMFEPRWMNPPRVSAYATLAPIVRLLSSCCEALRRVVARCQLLLGPCIVPQLCMYSPEM